MGRRHPRRRGGSGRGGPVKTLRILHYRRWKAAATVSAVFLLVVLFSVFLLKASPVYESKSVVTFLPTEFEIRFQDGRSDLAGLNAASVLTQTHTEFLLSRSLAESVIRRALAAHPPSPQPPSPALWVNQRLVAPAKGLFWKTYYTLNSGTFVEPTPIDDLTGKLMERIKIENVPASYILSISVEWDDPGFARTLAELLTEEYIAKVAGNNEKAIGRTLAQLEARADSIQIQLDDINRRIRDFKKGEKLFVLSKTVEFKMDELKSYLERRNEQRMRILALQGELQNKKNLLTTTDYEKMKADLTLAQDLSKDLESLIAGKQQELGAMPGKEFDFENLLIEKENHRARLARVFDDIGRTRMAKSAGVEPVKTIDPPLAAPYPKSPKVLVNAAAGLVLGCILFFGWVLAGEFLAPRIRSVQDLDPRLKHLGSLPPPPRPGSGSAALRPFRDRPPAALFHSHLRYLGDRILQEGKPRVIVIDCLQAEPARDRLVDGLLQGPAPVLLIDLAGKDGSLVLQKRAEAGNGALSALDPAKWRTGAHAGGDGSNVILELAVRPREITPLDLRDVEAVLANADPRCQVVIKPPPFKDFPLGYRLNRHADKVVFMVSADADASAHAREYLDVNLDNLARTWSVLADVTFTPDLVFKA